MLRVRLLLIATLEPALPNWIALPVPLPLLSTFSVEPAPVVKTNELMVLNVVPLLLSKLMIPVDPTMLEAEAMALGSDRIRKLLALFPNVIAPEKLLACERTTVAAAPEPGNVREDVPVMAFATVSVRVPPFETEMAVPPPVPRAPAAERVKVPLLTVVVPV